MTNDSLGDRMMQYEQAYKVTLPRRLPVIIRVDGRAFHTLTSYCRRPFDESLMKCMNEVARMLCEEIQGAQIAYVQSDEVSVLVHGYKTVNSQPWFNNELQKMVSVSASIAATAFNSAASLFIPSMARIATFDSRVFVLPEEEVCNYFIWRQQDASRNSVQMAAHTHFSPKECHGLSCDQLQEKLFQEKQINWNDFPTGFKRGRVVKRERHEMSEWGRTFSRHWWKVAEEIPLFTVDRAYIDTHVYIHKDEDKADARDNPAGSP